MPLRDDERVGAGASNRRPKAIVIARGDRLVGIEREDPVARRLGDAGVARRTEVVVPGELAYVRTMRARDGDCGVSAAGVDDDDFVGEAADRFQTSRQMLRF